MRIGIGRSISGLCEDAVDEGCVACGEGGLDFLTGDGIACGEIDLGNEEGFECFPDLGLECFTAVDRYVFLLSHRRAE